MLSFKQTMDRLLQAGSQLSKKSLERAVALDKALYYPSSAYPVIHIAGSNGKGSVATKIAKVLEAAGYKVGLYTSPHLVHFQERIEINGQWIEEERIVHNLKPIFALDETLQLRCSFFELTTFLAFDYFREEKVDIAVIETGLGGRLDATNVVNPILSVITSISCEHTHILGKTLSEIAAEKGGIIKPYVPVVLGPKARLSVLFDIAKKCHSAVHPCCRISSFYDEENSAIAELALESLSFDVSMRAKTALKERPACRFEKIGPVIFDVAHNPDAIWSLLQALHHSNYKKLRFLVGFSKDKDYAQCLALLASHAMHLHLVQANSFRAATLEDLQSALSQEIPYTAHATIHEGMQRAIKALCDEEILVVCGSFYIMEEAKRTLTCEGNFLSLVKS